MTEQASMLLDLSGYQRTLRYLPDGSDRSLKIAHGLMVFDLEFQSILMKYIGFFEIAFRSRYATAMAESRGPFAHRNPKNFSDPEFYQSFLNHYADELTRSASRNRQIADEVSRFGDVPIWTAVESMTFGTLSKLYKNTRSRAIKDSVSEAFGTGYQTFSSWLRSLSVARNECAHFGKLLGTRLVSQPKSIDGVPIRNDNPFCLVLILAKVLCEHVIFDDDASLSHDVMLIRDITELITARDRMRRLSGIPDDWKDLITLAMDQEGLHVDFKGDIFGAPKRGVCVTAGQHDGPVILD